jgi:hypothetical protein
MKLPRIRLKLYGYPVFSAAHLAERLQVVLKAPWADSACDEAMLWHLLSKLNSHPSEVNFTHVEAVFLAKYVVGQSSDPLDYGYWVGRHLLDLIDQAVTRARYRAAGITPKRDKAR